MRLFANVVSAQLQENIKEGHIYPVHSRFEHGVNLEVDKRLVFIGNKEEECLPYGILVPAGQLLDLQELFAGETAVWNADGFVTEHGCLCTKQAKKCSNLLRECPKNPVEVLIPEFPELDNLSTGFGISIRSAGLLWEEPKRCLAEAITNGTNLECVLPKWLGAGPGLTPSGDDYLTGMLAADTMYHFCCRKFPETVRKLIERGCTTDVSSNQLLCALDNLFSSSWIGFLYAYANLDEQRMKQYFGRILQYGHTSGRDMFAGFLMGLNIAKRGAQYGE